MRQISRREFLKYSIATSVAAGGLTIFGCSSSSDSSDANPDIPEGAELIPHATHFGAFNSVVLNGVMIGVQPLNDIDAFPTKMVTEGILDRLYDKTRIKFPMVRKSYLENLGGDTRPELRGKEPFVRVTWDEALAITANAILNTIEQYGNESIFSNSGWSHAGLFKPRVLQGRFFGLIGGHTTPTGDYSTGASQISLPHILGDIEVYSPQTAWEVLLQNTEVMVMIGCDPWKNCRIEYPVADHQMYPKWKQIKENGVQFISINPQVTRTDKELDAEWVKIIPNTDTALFLAMAYHVYTNDLHDQTYLNIYTVGLNQFLDYLLGLDADGTPAKTPEWAAQITGIPAQKIIELAELFASKRTQFAGAWSLQRADHGEMTHWSIINFAAMLGKIGKPGEGVGFSWHYGNGGMPVSGNAMPSSRFIAQGRNLVKTKCPASRITEMLLNPGKTYKRNGAEQVYPNIKLIHNAGGNYMSHHQNTNELIAALNGQVETIVCQDPWWCASARFADIVLPATTTLERNDIGFGGTYSKDKIYAMRQVVEPIGESLDDYEIFRQLAVKLGVEGPYSEGMTREGIIEDAYRNSSATMPFYEFWEKGVTFLDTPETARHWVRHGDFYQDPQANPLHTSSGKIELYCETIAGFNADGCPPMPKWIEPAEYLGNAQPGQVHVLSPHPYMRLHSQMANTSLRNDEGVQGRQYVLINPVDASNANIQDGDLVELYNERGSVIAGARLSEEIMPGVVTLEEGQWIQLDNQGRCNSGSINMITTSKACSELSQATSANTCIASMKKCTDAESPNRAFEPPAVETNNITINIKAMNLIERAKSVRSDAWADLEPAEKLYYQSCTQCHVTRDPEELTINEWRAVTQQSMFGYTSLSQDEQNMVLEFLEANAKDAL